MILIYCQLHCIDQSDLFILEHENQSCCTTNVRGMRATYNLWQSKHYLQMKSPMTCMPRQFLHDVLCFCFHPLLRIFAFCFPLSLTRRSFVIFNISVTPDKNDQCFAVCNNNCHGKWLLEWLYIFSILDCFML